MLQKPWESNLHLPQSTHLENKYPATEIPESLRIIEIASTKQPEKHGPRNTTFNAWWRIEISVSRLIEVTQVSISVSIPFRHYQWQSVPVRSRLDLTAVSLLDDFGQFAPESGDRDILLIKSKQFNVNSNFSLSTLGRIIRMSAAVQLVNRMSLFSKPGSPYRFFVARTFSVKPSAVSVKAQCVHGMARRHQFSSLACLQHFSSLGRPRNSLQHLNSLYTGCRNYSTQNNQPDMDKGSLVYMGRIGSMFKTLKLFSLTTSALGLSLQPYLFITYQDAPIVTAVPFFAALNIFVFINPLLIHHIGKKYVMEVYFNPTSKVFTAVLMSFFARKYNFAFKADDVHVPDVPGMFSILTVKGRPLFVLESDFTDVEVYKHMMGFDKPLDLSFLKDDKKDQTE
ncbi:transmembrane protein 70, mitochondrial [Elysia marginata]|uniref:Transmembrane protein 70, mitochondrial n=1 Tax=Elysia marginata TaxID=1093978 RepID=A0AAV4JMC1_9GAST|nr:transmembrane protein 70, mitochondrial [Elysia marginata]